MRTGGRQHRAVIQTVSWLPSADSDLGQVGYAALIPGGCVHAAKECAAERFRMGLEVGRFCFIFSELHGASVKVVQPQGLLQLFFLWHWCFGGFFRVFANSP